MGEKESEKNQNDEHRDSLSRSSKPKKKLTMDNEASNRENDSDHELRQVQSSVSTRSKRKDDHTSNAAIDFGMEDSTATKQDPRVSGIKPTKMEEEDKEDKPHRVANKVITRESALTPATSHRNFLSPTEASSPGALPIMMTPEEEEEDGNLSKYTNTDISFDPSMEFATKTTNTGRESMPLGGNIEDPDMDLDECFEVAIHAVKAAGAHIRDNHDQTREYTTKQHSHDLVTRTDNEVEDMMVEAIRKKYPNHKFICEEAISRAGTGNVELTDEPTWIIDPIDGTMNFVHHFPYYCISVAFVVNQITEFGIIYNPAANDCYTARRGMGAHLNGNRISTSGQTKIESSLILQEYCSGMNEKRTLVVLENAKRLIKKAHALRSIGSSAMGMAMVASGVADAFYYFGLHIWDIAAGYIIVTEAGGAVIDPAGGKFDPMSRRVLAASTETLAMSLSKELEQNYPKPRDDEPKSMNPDEYNSGGNQKIDFISQTSFSDSELSESNPK